MAGLADTIVILVLHDGCSTSNILSGPRWHYGGQQNMYDSPIHPWMDPRRARSRFGLDWIIHGEEEASKVVALMQAKLTPNQTGRKARQGKMQGAAA